MNARTIQHPGIEIHEIDMTEYRNTVVTNNAYVIGFADRGPIYDYSWITSRSEFINLYGTPQTEAEKYLFYAVQSILNNGGTPVVARMPYDNKQCKAYKALKIKYASVIPNADAEYGYTVNNWQNNSVYSANSEVLIDLEKTVGKYIDPDGKTSLHDVLSGQNVEIVKKVNINGVISGIFQKLNAEDIKKLTYKDVLFSLSDNLRFETDLSDDLETYYYDAILKNITSLRNYINIHDDKTISAFLELPSLIGADDTDKPTNLSPADELSYNGLLANLSGFADVSGISGIIELNPNLSTEKINLEYGNAAGKISGIWTEEAYNTIIDNRPIILQNIVTVIGNKIFEKIQSALAAKLEEIFKNSSEISKFSELISQSIENIWDCNSKFGELISKETIEEIKTHFSQSGMGQDGTEFDKFLENKPYQLLDTNFTNTSIKLLLTFDDLSTAVAGKFYYALFIGTYNDIIEKLNGITVADFVTNNDFIADNNIIFNSLKESLESAPEYNSNTILSATLPEILHMYKFAGVNTMIEKPFETISLAEAEGKIFKGIFDNRIALNYLTIIDTNITHIYAEYTAAKQAGTIDNKLTEINNNIEQLNLLKLYITAKTNRHDITLKGIKNLIETGSFCNPIFGCEDFKALWEYSLTDIIQKYIDAGAGETFKINKSYSIPDELKTAVIKLREQYSIFKLVADEKDNQGIIYNWIDIFLYDLDKQKIDYFKNGDDTVGNKIYVNGENPSNLGISDFALNEYVSPSGIYHYLLDPNDKNGVCAGSIEPSEIIAGNPQAKALDMTLANIYNDPYFKKIEDSEDQKQQAVIDAHLLTTPEVSYKYGVYLDSTNCVISNEQYDDLVTAGNFTKADPEISNYGEDIDTANFIIVDKNKSISDGVGGNEGFFVSIIDPYDALKSQRLLVNPKSELSDIGINSYSTLADYGMKSKYNWKALFKNELNTMNCLQHVVNADNITIGEITKENKHIQLLDSWSKPLAADYYDDSISKTLMNLYPQIPLTDANSSNSDSICSIDKLYSSHIVVAVCKTVINPSDGKITVRIIEQFFGSLFNEKSVSTGASLYIGDAINTNSNYIEFFRNDYIKPSNINPEYATGVLNKTQVPQFFIEGSQQLTNTCSMVGIDNTIYDVDNKYFDENDIAKPGKPAGIIGTYKEYIAKLKENNIFIFNKKNTILYNNHPTAVLTSFSKKESQKIMVSTSNLHGASQGTTINVAKNFLVDMDRCISYIKNVDQIPIYFVADAGLSTIAQFCDNIIWDSTTNRWVTQVFDPDHDPDIEDKTIKDASSVSTWRKVIDKLDQISREIRKDCLTIIDAPRQLTLDGSAQKIRPSRPQNSWDELVGEKLRYISGINSSYTAGYYNWLRMTDEFSGIPMWLPPTCKLIGNYVYLNAINQPWLAPAGMNYGSIQGIYGLSHNPNSNEEDQIYLKSWNYIKQYPFDGFVVEGQKTTLTKESAFNRVNVRTLFLDLERFVTNVARTYRYTVNNSYTREQFVHTLKAKFEDYTIRNGIYDYMIVCDDTNNTPETIDAQELRCAIYVKPARLIEFVLVDFIAAKSGANFSEITI